MRFAVTQSDRRVEIVFDDGGMNLLSREAIEELRDVVAPFSGASQDSVRLLLFRSARPNLFAAGADMSQMKDFDSGDAESFSRLGQEVLADIERLPIATVALIDGDCFGGALDLALSFDLRFATSRSRFSHPGARLGIVTGFGGTSRWRKVMSRSAAAALFLANPILTAEEARATGLIDRAGDEHDEDLRRLELLDGREVRFVKELARHAGRLTRSQIALMADRLGHLYFG